MNSDIYTKVVLTVIAACLVSMSLGGPSLMSQAQAQQPPQRVIISGWDSSGDSRAKALPLPVHDYGTGGLPTR
jgi:hypothetical protein